MNSRDTAPELATRYRDAFFARDVDAIMAPVTPDFVFENVTGGERIEGAEAARRIEWDGIDLIQVRDGHICRNAVDSSAHAARPADPE